MSFFEFPHTRTYDSDLGWIIKKIKEIIDGYETINAWKATHTTEYRELKKKVDGLINNILDVVVPWDSSIAYNIYSIVEYQGENYIAVQNVPVGTMITNTDYWQPANTVVEQINAISVRTSELSDFVEDEVKIIPIYAGGAWGDSTLVIFPNGKSMLIDVYNADGAQYVANVLTEYGITAVDYIMISHYHYDHFGGITSEILQDYITNATIFFLPQDVPNTFTSLYDDMTVAKDVIESKGATIVQPVTNGEIYTIDDNTNLQFLNVVHSNYYNLTPFDYNNCSLCAKLNFFDKSAFFSGDIATAAQNALSGNVGNVTVFKAQHHGSDEFQNAKFLEELSPEITYCCNATPAEGYYYQRQFGVQMASFGKSVYLTETNGTFEIELTAAGAKTVAAADGIYNTITSVYQLIGYGTRSESQTVTLSDLLASIPYNTRFDFTVNLGWLPNFLNNTGITYGDSVAFVITGTKFYNNYYTIRIYDITKSRFWIVYVENNVINTNRTREYTEILTVDMTAEVTSTSGASIVLTPPNAKKILSANILYNDDWYYLIRTDGRTPFINIRQNNTVGVLLTGAYAADRSLPVRITYVPQY